MSKNSGCGESIFEVVFVIICGCLIWWVLSDKQERDANMLVTTKACTGHGHAERVIGWQAEGDLILCSNGEIRFESYEEKSK